MKLLLMTFSCLYFFCCLFSCSPDGNPNPITSPIVNDCDHLYPALNTIISSHTPFTKTHYPERIKSFMATPIWKGDVVLLGNSLVEQGGDWVPRLGISNVKNRGISGDNCYGVLAYADQIACSQPSIIFLQIGTNDVFLTDSPELITSNIQQIASILKTADTKVYVQTIMPVTFGHPQTQRIAEVNVLLRAANSKDFIVIDTFNEMADERDALPDSYTTDGVHLTELGYQKWASFLKTYL
jgi:lysophospholipase L1-like esterase